MSSLIRSWLETNGTLLAVVLAFAVVGAILLGWR